MKKLIAVVLCVMMALSALACAPKQEEAPAAAPAAPAATTTEAAATTEEIVYDVEAYKAHAEEGMQTTIECEPIELSMGCSGTIEGTVQGDAVNAAMEAVSRWTNGAVKVNFYPSGQLGGDLERHVYELAERRVVQPLGLVVAEGLRERLRIPAVHGVGIGQLRLVDEQERCNAEKQHHGDETVHAPEAARRRFPQGRVALVAAQLLLYGGDERLGRHVAPEPARGVRHLQAAELHVAVRREQDERRDARHAQTVRQRVVAFALLRREHAVAARQVDARERDMDLRPRPPRVCHEHAAFQQPAPLTRVAAAESEQTRPLRR